MYKYCIMLLLMNKVIYIKHNIGKLLTRVNRLRLLNFKSIPLVLEYFIEIQIKIINANWVFFYFPTDLFNWISVLSHLDLLPEVAVFLLPHFSEIIKSRLNVLCEFYFYFFSVVFVGFWTRLGFTGSSLLFFLF